LEETKVALYVFAIPVWLWMLILDPLIEVLNDTAILRKEQNLSLFPRPEARRILRAKEAGATTEFVKSLVDIYVITMSKLAELLGHYWATSHDQPLVRFNLPAIQ